MTQVAVAAGFDVMRFAQAAAAEVCSFQFESDHRRVPTQATLGAVLAGDINVVTQDGHGGQSVERRREHIQADPADWFVLTVARAGHLRFRQDGVDSEVAPGRALMVTTQRPFYAHIASSPGDPFCAWHIRVPASSLRRRAPQADGMCNRPLDLRHGAGRILETLVATTIEEASLLSQGESERAGATILEAIANLVQSTAEHVAVQAPPRQRSPDGVVARARTYLLAHLSDPELDTARVARHCRVSVRYLHHAFAVAAGTTPSRFVRECRLQGARTALQTPALAGRTIIAIAGDWGFEDPAHFCHAYKARFGRTPRQDRAAASPAAVTTVSEPRPA